MLLDQFMPPGSSPTKQPQLLSPFCARAPLRRVDSGQALPADLAFIETERLTPLFVLVEKGHEIGRIRGYPGEDHFWGLLGVLIKQLDASRTTDERAQALEKTLHAID